jgi:probable addiction module antidote protein
MKTMSTDAFSKSYDDYLRAELADPELAAAYLTAAAEDGSIEQFLIALRAVAEAHGGIGAVAEAAHLNRQTMYRTLSGEGNPTLSTLLAMLRVMKLNLAFTPESRN